MKLRHWFIALATAGIFFLASLLRADTRGGNLNVHNHTGHEVLAFLFMDGSAHLDPAGGVQFAHLKDGESAVAHVARSPFAILLVDHDDLWHAEVNSLQMTDLTFTAGTGHAKKSHH
jgi:hypothetical protein